MEMIKAINIQWIIKQYMVLVYLTVTLVNLDQILSVNYLKKLKLTGKNLTLRLISQKNYFPSHIKAKFMLLRILKDFRLFLTFTYIP